MMKYIPLILLNFFLFCNVNAQNISIVSDLDDTIKITNSNVFSRAVWNALFSKRAFKGMPSLIEEMQSYTTQLYILSASPRIINKKIRGFLNKNDIVYKKLYTRNLRQLADKFNYKRKVIKNILENTPDSLILLGDDVEIDQDVYMQIKSAYPERIQSIYIHKVTNRPLLTGVKTYYTALDIAVNEYLENRMTFSSLLMLVQQFVDTPTSMLKDYFPAFAYCPMHIDEFVQLTNSELEQIITPIYKRIVNYCRSK